MTSPKSPSSAAPTALKYVVGGLLPEHPEAATEAAWAREEAEREEAARRESAIDLWRRSGVPARHAEAQGVDPTGPWEDAFARVRPLLGTGAIVLLHGRRGTGKTQMAVEAIRLSCRAGRSALYAKAMSVFLDIRDSFGPERREKAAVERYTAPATLVIDAMEERGETPFEDRVLNHIIDRRYDDLKDTIIVTNQTKEDFARSVGPSVASRIVETGIAVECAWDTFRKRAEA